MGVTMLDWLLYYNPDAVPAERGGRYTEWTADGLPLLCPGFYAVPGAKPGEPCPDGCDDCKACRECWQRDIADIIPPGTAESVSMYIRGLREGWDRGLAALKDVLIRRLTGPETGRPTERELRVPGGDMAGLGAIADKDSSGEVRNEEG